MAGPVKVGFERTIALLPLSALTLTTLYEATAARLARRRVT